MPTLDEAVAAARRATIELHSLMAIHGIQFQELHLLLVWPAGLRQAHAWWTDRMVDVIRALAQDEGMPDPTKLSERDQIALTHRAHDLVMS
jgi:hypothetical protein